MPKFIKILISCMLIIITALLVLKQNLLIDKTMQTSVVKSFSVDDSKEEINNSTAKIVCTTDETEGISKADLESKSTKDLKSRDYLVIYSNNNLIKEPEYKIFIESYSQNASYIEYPQIEGMKSEELQNKINTKLKDETIKGPKIYGNKNFVNFEKPDVVYEYSTRIGFTNEFIASFEYSFESIDPSSTVTGMNHRYFYITINMKTGERIYLTDFMEVDDRLINSGVPAAPEPDYNGVVTPTFYRFKDAFRIYTSDKERDSYHTNTPEWIIETLKDKSTETKWFIEKNKDITFYAGIDYNFVTIPVVEIKYAIYPEYLEILGE